MGCDAASLMNQLKSLVNQIDEPCPSQPRPAPCVVPALVQPYAQVTITQPPPGLLPTNPQPVKPLQLPPYPYPPEPEPGTTEDDFKSRYANFYNNYNYQWRAKDDLPPEVKFEPKEKKTKGVTVDGSTPFCSVPKCKDPNEGCPTGFKPCTMAMTAPPGCNPCGIWEAQIQNCRPKSKFKYYRNCCFQ